MKTITGSNEVAQHTNGTWRVNSLAKKCVSIEGDYSITVEYPEGYKRICIVAADDGYIPETEARANAHIIVKAVNNYQKLLDSNRELLDALNDAHFIMKEEGYRAGNNPYMRKVEKAIENAKNIQ